MTDSGIAVKWVLQRLRSTNVTNNGYNEMVCDNCNAYFTGVLDRRRSITKYVSQHSCERHVGGGVTPQCDIPKNKIFLKFNIAGNIILFLVNSNLEKNFHLWKF